MKKTWSVIAMLAAFCAACDDNSSSDECAAGASVCADGAANQIKTCVNGAYETSVCPNNGTCSNGKCSVPTVSECDASFVSECKSGASGSYYQKCDNGRISTQSCTKSQVCKADANGKPSCVSNETPAGSCTEGKIICSTDMKSLVKCENGKEVVTACAPQTCQIVGGVAQCKDVPECTNGTVQCSSDSNAISTCKDGKWGAPVACEGGAVCDSTKGKCVSIAEENGIGDCGADCTVEGGKPCSEVCGANEIAACDTELIYCLPKCDAKDVGKNVDMCSKDSTYGFSELAHTTCIPVAGGYGLFAQSSDLCAAACNANNTACDAKGTASSVLIDCSAAKLSATETVKEHCGKDKTGVCLLGEKLSFRGCSKKCDAGEVGKSQGKVCEVEEGVGYTNDTVCTAVGDNYYAVMDVKTEEQCAAGMLCNAEGTDCGNISVGDECGSSFAGVCKDTKTLLSCDNKTNKIVENACPAEASLCNGTKCISALEALGLVDCGSECLYEKDGATHPCSDACKDKAGTAAVCYGEKILCIDTCKTGDADKNVCEKNGDKSYESVMSCAKLNDTQNVYIPLEMYSCTNACKDESVCDDKGKTPVSGDDSGTDGTDAPFECGDYEVPSGGTVAEDCGSQVGICFVNPDGSTGYDCYEKCSASDVGKQKNQCNSYKNGDFDDVMECQKISSSYVYFETDEYKACPSGCKADKTGCN